MMKLSHPIIQPYMNEQVAHAVHAQILEPQCHLFCISSKTAITREMISQYKKSLTNQNTSRAHTRTSAPAHSLFADSASRLLAEFTQNNDISMDESLSEFTSKFSVDNFSVMTVVAASPHRTILVPVDADTKIVSDQHSLPIVKHYSLVPDIAPLPLPLTSSFSCLSVAMSFYSHHASVGQHLLDMFDTNSIIYGIRRLNRAFHRHILFTDGEWWRKSLQRRYDLSDTQILAESTLTILRERMIQTKQQDRQHKNRQTAAATTLSFDKDSALTPETDDRDDLPDGERYFYRTATDNHHKKKFDDTRKKSSVDGEISPALSLSLSALPLPLPPLIEAISAPKTPNGDLNANEADIRSVNVFYAAVIHYQCRLNRFSSLVMHQSVPYYPTRTRISLLDCFSEAPQECVGLQRPDYLTVPRLIRALLLATPPFYETNAYLEDGVTLRLGETADQHRLKGKRPHMTDDFLKSRASSLSSPTRHNIAWFVDGQTHRYGFLYGPVYIYATETSSASTLLGIDAGTLSSEMATPTGGRANAPIRQCILDDSECLPIVVQYIDENRSEQAKIYSNNIQTFFAPRCWQDDIFRTLKLIVNEEIEIWRKKLLLQINSKQNLQISFSSQSTNNNINNIFNINSDNNETIGGVTNLEQFIASFSTIELSTPRSSSSASSSSSKDSDTSKQPPSIRLTSAMKSRSAAVDHGKSESALRRHGFNERATAANRSQTELQIVSSLTNALCQRYHNRQETIN